MNLEEQIVEPINQPRPFKEIPKLWLQITNMNEDFFMNEISHTSPSNTIYGVLLYAGIIAFFSAIQSLLSTLIGSYAATGIEQQTDIMAIMAISTPMLICFGLIGTPVSFYISNGIYFLSATIFGGEGKFNKQAYLNSLFIAPLGLLTIAASFIALIPIIGFFIYGIISIGIMIFQIILTIRLFKVVHHFSSRRAIAAILSPMLLLLLPLCLILILALMGPMIGDVFSNINADLLTPVP